MKRPDIKRKERDTILQALRAGVVPRIGLQHIQVARTREIEQLVEDMERITDGGAAIRFIIGEYGSGKTFFLSLVQMIALEKGLVVMSADLAPDRRLHATGGQARALFAELSRNTATRTKPEGGALGSIMERFISQAAKEAQDGDVAGSIRAKLAHLEELVGGYEFATVISRYWEGLDTSNEDLKSSAMRWLRAEFATRTDARNALGVRTFIDDASIYDHLKLFSLFVREAGYKGLLVSLDELVNLYKLSSSQARKSNYEQILRILNDVLQGSAAHLGFTFGGTPEFLFDTRRGMYSYEALQTRLAPNSFAAEGYLDLSGPVVQLENLSPDHLHVLLENIRRVFLANESTQVDVPDQALDAFRQHCSRTVGDAYFRTPRNSITAFVNMLAILEQNPSANWQSLLGGVTIEADGSGSLEHAGTDETDDDLATFKL